MPTLRLFATVRVAAGTGKVVIDGGTVGDVLANASSKFGAEFESLIPVCRVWVNGDAADFDTEVQNGDEVALLPPVSGG